jgi:hypothetical protein
LANLTSILSTDLISAAPSVLTGNFQNLNLSKAEASVLNAKVQISSVAGSAMSLTTAAGDVATVLVKGYATGSTGTSSIALIYDGTTKDATAIRQAATTDVVPFTLMYAETPGAQTASILTSVVAGTHTLSDVKIITQVIT